MALETVADYITEARRLMQDETVPYRYSDASIVSALNMGIDESFRLRPDMWLAYFELSLPSYSAGTPGATVVIPVGFRVAFLYFIVGITQLRDQEDVTDARAGQLLQKFGASLVGPPS